jgi:hypothetical protein
MIRMFYPLRGAWASVLKLNRDTDPHLQRAFGLPKVWRSFDRVQQYLSTRPQLSVLHCSLDVIADAGDNLNVDDWCSLVADAVMAVSFDLHLAQARSLWPAIVEQMDVAWLQSAITAEYARMLHPFAGERGKRRFSMAKVVLQRI